MCATLCSLNRCILFSVFYVLPFGVINDDDDDDYSQVQYQKEFCNTKLHQFVTVVIQDKVLRV